MTIYIPSFVFQRAANEGGLKAQLHRAAQGKAQRRPGFLIACWRGRHSRPVRAELIGWSTTIVLRTPGMMRKPCLFSCQSFPQLFQLSASYIVFYFPASSRRGRAESPIAPRSPGQSAATPWVFDCVLAGQTFAPCKGRTHWLANNNNNRLCDHGKSATERCSFSSSPPHPENKEATIFGIFLFCFFFIVSLLTKRLNLVSKYFL